MRASVPLSRLAVASSSAMMIASFKIALQSSPLLQLAKCHCASCQCTPVLGRGPQAPALKPGQPELAG